MVEAFEETWLQIPSSPELWAAIAVLERLAAEVPRNEAELDRLAAARQFLVDLTTKAREEKQRCG